MKPLLQVNNISKTYPGQSSHAVNQISLDVLEGEMLAIVGASGSGKTTLLKLIAGLEEKDEGDIFLHEEKITGPSEKLIPGHPKIKMVFQDNKLFPNITVYDNIQHTLRAYHTAYQQERIAQVLEIAKLTHLKHKYPRELSGGEGQRATLARALADEPEVLLLDEPFSHLDIPLKRQIKGEIEQIIQASGVTSILVTHDTADALSMANRIALLKNGNFIQIASPKQMYEQPATPYVAQFFGEVTIVEWAALQPYLKKEISFPVEGQIKVCIRAEDVIIASGDVFHCKGKVTRISYFGAYSSVEASVSETLTLVLHTTIVSIKMGEWIPLLIQTKNIHFFADK